MGRELEDREEARTLRDGESRFSEPSSSQPRSSELSGERSSAWDGHALYRPGDGALQTVPLETVRYDTTTGLVPVVVQDVRTGAVLMVAYANREALKRTFGTGEAWFWSRSRQDFWRKGASSGNTQRVVEVRVDCDGDTVLYLVEAAGPACHTGETSCFFRAMEHKAGMGKTAGQEQRDFTEATNLADGAGAVAGDGGLVAAETSAGSAVNAAISAADVAPVVGDMARAGVPDSADASVLQQLWTVLEERWRNRPQGSYTTYLFEHGVDKIGKKVGEEGVEVVIAAKNAVSSEAGREELAAESADLLYHLMALWKMVGLQPGNVYQVLRERHSPAARVNGDTP